MQKPSLVVMAAGMGSRYGGLKQIDPVGRHGEIIIDYSLYDAMRAGFEKVVFIINHRIEADFKDAIGRRAERHIGVTGEVKEYLQVVSRQPEPGHPGAGPGIGRPRAGTASGYRCKTCRKSGGELVQRVPSHLSSARNVRRRPG